MSQALRDWCRLNDAKTGYIEPGAPWQNPFVGSFDGHLRRELLGMESFNTLYEAQLLLDDCRLEYNPYRPHQSLNYMTSGKYARRRRTDNQPRLS
jgi:transposase InsO family protein